MSSGDYPPIGPTLTAAQAAAILWNVAIVGAGPAGAFAATLLSRRGRRVLLVDRNAFPRDKPCGCCLNAGACSILHEAGLSSILASALPLDQLLLRRNHRELILPLNDSYALSRRNLDSSLVLHAIDNGAHFLPQASAQLLPGCPQDPTLKLSLQRHGEQSTVQAELVLACDGLRGQVLERYPECRWKIADDAWMGIACTLELSIPSTPPSAIAMHIGRSGYVGIVHLEDGSPHIAAALSPTAIREAGGPVSLIRSILLSCDITDCPPLDEVAFLGTPLLTRHRLNLGAHRILALGDACAYVEPFTGEGIAWALLSARELVTLLPHSLEEFPSDLPQIWTRRHAHLLHPHQRLCRSLRYLLHRPWLGATAYQVAATIPAIPAHLAHRVNHPVAYAASSPPEVRPVA